MSDHAFGGHWGKRSTGFGEKPSDQWALPLCRPVYEPNSVIVALRPDLHRQMHNIGCHGRQHGHQVGFIEPATDQATRDSLELRFWRQVNRNPFIIADTLYRDLGSGESAFKKPRKSKGPRPKREKAFGFRPSRKTLKAMGATLEKAPKQKISSKGFDKTKTRKMDGSVKSRKR